MIRIHRGAEPPELQAIRDKKLAVLRALGREPTSDEIDGYAIVSENLWKAQFHKCCYCENRIPKSYNDVEHFRPKALAHRIPGCNLTHGYWWLAYTWENLLFACPSCNRSYKRSSFPTEVGSISLIAEDQPVDGRELPFLIDPSSNINPIEHIQYTPVNLGNTLQWYATSRNHSVKGVYSIRDYGLNDQEKIELRKDHIDALEPTIKLLLHYLQQRKTTEANNQFQVALSFLGKQSQYVCLTYDAFSYYIEDQLLQTVIGKGWPSIDRLPL